MMKGKKLSSLIIAVLLTQGCANFNTYHKKDTYDTPASTAVDAKQRFLLTAKSPGDGRQVFCAEPSPDVFSVFAASVDADVAEKAALKGAFSESGASLGIRTQSIQSLVGMVYVDEFIRECTTSYREATSRLINFDRLSQQTQSDREAGSNKNAKDVDRKKAEKAWEDLRNIAPLEINKAEMKLGIGLDEDQGDQVISNAKIALQSEVDSLEKHCSDLRDSYGDILKSAFKG